MMRPIVVPKPKWTAKAPSLWIEKNGEDDADYKYVFKQQLGFSLRKRVLNLPPPNPDFDYKFNPAIDTKEFNKNLVLEVETSDDIKTRIGNFVKEFWDVFREAGVKIPVREYEMVIDTGDHQPIAVRKPHYGMHEAPIMQKTIDTLLQLGHIAKDRTSPWGFRITLAPKPHQENVTDINEYIWRFCINYILLNKITRPAEYPIPRCDDAVMFGFGEALFFILLDAFSGYHQVRLSPTSAAKTAFYAPEGRKYIFLVMPFGVRNAPTLFLAMMHDLRELWTDMCRQHGITPSASEGTTIIMDDTFLFSVSVENAFIAVRCVCMVARKYNLTWKLSKCRWFPSRVEFVGVDIHKHGNAPAQSKNEMIQNWKLPKSPRDILSFIGFAIFYSRWIDFFELKITKLRNLVSEYDTDHIFINDEFDTTHAAIYKLIQDRLLSIPILQRANIKKRFYLKTDFSSLGLGFALCQPDDSVDALAAMKREDEGGICEFDLTLSTPLRLLPIAFGSRRTVGNEKSFHSHPGEALAATWSILKNRHFLWGRPFTLVSDCSALLWIMSYKGNNHAVVRLQLELTGYWFTIANRPGRMLEDANYFSRLGEETHIDPLLRDYLSFARQLYTKNPPGQGDITVDNLPGRRKKARIEAEHITTVNLAHIPMPPESEVIYDIPPHQQLHNTPIVFLSTEITQETSRKHFCYVTESAVALKASYWCIYQPQFGHFLQSAKQLSINFEATIVIENDQSCRSFLQEYWKVPMIHEKLSQLIDYYTSTINPPTINGYYICAPAILAHTQAKQWLNMQSKTIHLLLKCSNLETFLLEYRDNFTDYSIQKFTSDMRDAGWVITQQQINSSEYSDRVDTSFHIIVATHLKDQSTVKPETPSMKIPPRQPNDFGSILYNPFNDEKHAIPYIGTHFQAEPCAESNPRRPTVELHLRAKGIAPVDLGYQVFDKCFPAPLPSINAGGFFGQLFGLTFDDAKDNSKTHIRAISNSEYVDTFGYDKNFNFEISDKPGLLDRLKRTIPARTMQTIVEATSIYLSNIKNQKTQANAARFDLDLSIPALFSGVIKDELPDDHAWKSCYSTDPQCTVMWKMVENPSLINTEKLQQIDSIYRAPMRNSQIKIIENRLCFLEPVAHSTTTVKLIIVPNDLRRHVFTGFHANPIGGHFSLYYTLHRIRLRFHWPHMYSYIKRAIGSCAGCILKNHGARPGSELLYAFPVDAPFMTIHADLWVPGKTISFEGITGLMVVMCHMTGFTAIEPIREANAKEFAKAIYRVQLRYGLSHLLITDPDSKFNGVFTKAAQILKLQHHQTARGNHDAVLVERFNRFLNAALKVFNNDHETNRVFVEGALMAAYAWNSAPVAGTDLSRSLLVLGREFHFPIDFTSRQHITFKLDDKDVKTFASNMLELLEKSQEVYKLLIHEHRAYHRELRNAQIGNPRKFKLHDVVFARVQVQSVASKGQVKKLRYVTRGPYKIIKLLPSGSYGLKLHTSDVIIKKHGSDLFLSPKNLIPFEQLKTSDRLFGELDKPLSKNPYAIADIDGFSPSKPWTAPAALANVKEARNVATPFPTVAEMDASYDSWPESGNPFATDNESSALGQSKRGSTRLGLKHKDHPDQVVTLNTLAGKSTTSASLPFSQTISDIVKSEDKLFFIAHSPTSENRKEWKLVQIDFDKSMQLHPACLQDGKFLVNFLIQHRHDDSVNLPDKRFWIEYHAAASAKTLSSSYHLLTPSSISPQIALNRNLVPYREWIQLRHDDRLIHGPFNFSTLNGRKTRDRISETDWDILISSKAQYHSAAPHYSNHLIQVNWNETAHEIIQDHTVDDRISSFHFQMHFNDETLHEFGYDDPETIVTPHFL